MTAAKAAATAPVVPSFGHALGAAVALRLRRMTRGRLVWVAAGAAALMVVVGWLLVYLGDNEPNEVLLKLFDVPFRRLLVPLLPFLACATAISEEVDGRTLVYLDLRPASRSAILWGKYLAAMLVTGSILCGSVVLLHVGAYVTDPSGIFEEWEILARGLAVGALGGAYYGALTLLSGALLVEVPYLLSLLFFVVFDLFLGWLPGVVRLASVGYHLANLLGTEERVVLVFETPEVSAWLSAAVIGILTAGFVALATLTYASAQYAYSRGSNR